MHAPIKYFEKGLAVAANGAWVVFNGLNQIAQHPSFTPAWSDKPLLKSYQKTKPPLDRKSTRLNSSHANISYAVFCLKKKKKKSCIITPRRETQENLIILLASA